MDSILTVVGIFLVIFFIKMLFVMWGWSLFMVPIFGLQSLSLGQAFGFTVLAQCFAGSSTTSK